MKLIRLINIVFSVVFLIVILVDLSSSQVGQPKWQRINGESCQNCMNRCDSLTKELECNCDADCQIYKDCCPGWDSEECGVREPSIPGPYPPFQCHLITVSDTSSSPRYNRMVSECPSDWSNQEVEANCLSPDSNGCRLPPVTDVSTGFVYRNEFCAACNRVVDIAVWRYEVRCSEELRKLLRPPPIGVPPFVITESVIAEFCTISHFSPPLVTQSLPLVPRICYPSIAECLPIELIQLNISMLEYNQLVDGCENDVVQQLTDCIDCNFPYRNAHCAMCNNLDPFCVSIQPGSGGRPSLSVTLDIFGDGLIVIRSDVITTNITVNCTSSEVYDPVSEMCRQALVCDGATIGSCFNSDCNDTLLNLTRSVDDFSFVNSTTILYNDEVFAIEFNTTEGDPVICVDLSRNGTRVENVTINIYGYPAAFFVLTYIGCSLSVIGTALILLTNLIFKELRTLPSKILMNLAVAILVSNLLIILGVPVSSAFPDVVDLCVGTAILLHFFFLSQFSWMSIMSFEMTRIFYQASRLRTKDSERKQSTILSLYMFVGWSIPLLITVITIIVNYTRDGLVLYGVLPDGSLGSCWINHLESAVIAFVTPLSISLIFNIITFIIVSVFIIKAVRSQAKLGKKNNTSYIRLNVAVFTTSGLTWLFGFLAILARTSWSWYPFIIFNSTQGFVIFLAFLCTKRVAKLYSKLLTFKKEKLSTASGTKPSAIVSN